MKKTSDKNNLSEKKYKPFGFLNLLIGSLPIVLGTVIGILSDNPEMQFMTEIVFIVISFVILFIRNLKCKNIFKHFFSQ